MKQAEQIKADIARRGLTRIAYAKLMGVERDTVYKWLSGNIKPSKQTLKLMKLSTLQLEELAETKTRSNVKCAMCGARLPVKSFGGAA